MSDEPLSAPPEPAAGRGPLRIFLMVAGGLAAPALALAAFFVTNSGQAAPARPPVAQAGLGNGGSAAHGGGPSAAVSPPPRPATTTTTVPPAPAGPPARDPFVPLVGQAPPSGTAAAGH